MDKKTKKEIDKQVKKFKKTGEEGDKKIKKLTGIGDENDEDLDDYLKYGNDEELNNIQKNAEKLIKEEDKKKCDPDYEAEKNFVDELVRVSTGPKSEKKKKKSKKHVEKEEDENFSVDEEECKKWKEQNRLKKLKKEKMKEKEKNKKKKNIDKNEEEEDIEEFTFIKNKENKDNNKDIEDDVGEFPSPENEKNKNNDEEEKDNKKELWKSAAPVIPKKIYGKIRPNDLKVVLNILKNSNDKYREGLNLYIQGKYSYSLNFMKHAKIYFKHSKISFMRLNKLIQSKPDVYPKEFRMIITSKINDKIILVEQLAKECSTLMKEKRAEFIINNPKETNEFLAKQNSLGNNNKDTNPIPDTNYNVDSLNKCNNNNQNNINTNRNLNNNNNAQDKQKSLDDKEDDAKDQKIESEIISKNHGIKFSDIIGMKDIKQALYENIVVPIIRPDFFTGIRKPQRSILLFGPPGTGKTMIAKAIASECGSIFFYINASSLTSKSVEESEKVVKSLFKIVYKKVPNIIFIDEIDKILSKGSESENEAIKRLKTEFLIQFDGLWSNTNERLLVIAATNRPMDLDETLLRRLPKRFYCGPLDEEGRFKFIKKIIKSVETNLSDNDIREIAKKTNNYSNSDLMELCREASYQPVTELSKEEILKLKKFRPLAKQDLLNAVGKIRASLNKKIREEFQKWNEQFGVV